MNRGLMAAVAVAAIAGTTAAQQPAGTARVPAPPTPAAKAEAERVITAAGAGDVFEDASAGNLPGARHCRSRVICDFETGSPDNRIVVVPGSRPRGEDVECVTSDAGIVTTLRMTLDRTRTTPQVAMGRAAKALAQQYPGAKRSRSKSFMEKLGPLERPKDGAEILRARYDIVINGQPRLAQLHLRQFGGWTLEQRAIGGREDVALDVGSELGFSTTVLVWMSDMMAALK